MCPLNENSTISDSSSSSSTMEESNEYSRPPLYGAGVLTAIPMYNHDGSVMLDHKSEVLYQSQYLSTHPVRSECKERVGYGGRKLTYVSGDSVIRTMNLVFGHCGWSTEVTSKEIIVNEKDDRGRWNVGYSAMVKLSIPRFNIFHEDCGTGEGIDPSKVKSHDKALKSAITDAMKRAARHLGERLGNALYVKNGGIKASPLDNKKAIENSHIKESLFLFGDQQKLQQMYKSPNNGNSNDESKKNETKASSNRVQGQTQNKQTRNESTANNANTSASKENTSANNPYSATSTSSKYSSPNNGNSYTKNNNHNNQIQNVNQVSVQKQNKTSIISTTNTTNNNNNTPSPNNNFLSQNSSAPTVSQGSRNSPEKPQRRNIYVRNSITNTEKQTNFVTIKSSNANTPSPLANNRAQNFNNRVSLSPFRPTYQNNSNNKRGPPINNGNTNSNGDVANVRRKLLNPYSR